MTKPVIAPAFCQVAWVVRDPASAEKFFVETMGINRFMHMDNLAAKDTEGTYLGKPTLHREGDGDCPDKCLGAISIQAVRVAARDGMPPDSVNV